MNTALRIVTYPGVQKPCLAVKGVDAGKVGAWLREQGYRNIRWQAVKDASGLDLNAFRLTASARELLAGEAKPRIEWDVKPLSSEGTFPEDMPHPDEYRDAAIVDEERACKSRLTPQQVEEVDNFASIGVNWVPAMTPNTDGLGKLAQSTRDIYRGVSILAQSLGVTPKRTVAVVDESNNVLYEQEMR